MKRNRDNRNRPARFEQLENRQLMAAGDLDLTFGNGGKVIAQAVGFAVADVAVQADGKIVAVGSLNRDFAVARLNANGTLDKTFGGRGIVRTDFGGQDGDVANAVVIQPNGKIVVAGARMNHGDTLFGDFGGFALARYNANGTLDRTFDGNGTKVVEFSGAGRRIANALAIQSDGRILVAGSADQAGFSGNNSNFAVARLLSNGNLDNTFGSFVATSVNGVVVRSGKATIDFGGSFIDAAHAIAVASD